MNSRLQQKTFGLTRDGQTAYLYLLRNQHGMEAVVTNYGAILVSVKVPDRRGKLDDVVLGYETLDGYMQDKSY